MTSTRRRSWYRYEGDFLKGQFHGRGRYMWSNGGYYEARWSQLATKHDTSGIRTTKTCFVVYILLHLFGIVVTPTFQNSGI